MALAIWRSKLLSTFRDGLREGLPIVLPELISRARALLSTAPAPMQRVAKLGLQALAARSKTAAWLLDRAQTVMDDAFVANGHATPATVTHYAVAFTPEPAAAWTHAPAFTPAPDQAFGRALDHALGEEPALPAEPGMPARSLEELAYAMRAVSAETCVGAIADLTDRGDAAAGALLLDLLEDASGFFIPLTRLAAARGLQRITEADAARLDRLLQYENDFAIREELLAVSNALHRS